MHNLAFDDVTQKSVRSKQIIIFNSLKQLHIKIFDLNVFVYGLNSSYRLKKSAQLGELKVSGASEIRSKPMVGSPNPKSKTLFEMPKLSQ
jgi:hypothetical protein